MYMSVSIFKLTKVNASSAKPEKVEDEESGDEVEEANGTARIPLVYHILLTSSRRKKEKEKAKEKEGSYGDKTNLATKNRPIKAIPFRTVRPR